MANFAIYGQLKQFGDSSEFSLAGNLPQFDGNITINNLDFQIAGELEQFEGAIESVQGRTFAVAGILPQFSGDIEVVHGSVFGISGTFKQFTGSVEMSHGRQFTISGTLKQFTGAISMLTDSDFSIAGTLKQFTGDIQFAGSFNVLCLTPALKVVTEYSNFNFDSFFEHEGSYYGIGSTGNIYLFGGSTDAGAAISAYLDSGDVEYADGQQSKILDAHALGRTSTSMSLTLYEDDGTGNTYASIGDATGSLQNHRFKPGKGAEGRRWRYRLANVTGGTMEIQQLKLLVAELSRKR